MKPQCELEACKGKVQESQLGQCISYIFVAKIKHCNSKKLQRLYFGLWFQKGRSIRAGNVTCWLEQHTGWSHLHSETGSWVHRKWGKAAKPQSPPSVIPFLLQGSPLRGSIIYWHSTNWRPMVQIHNYGGLFIHTTTGKAELWSGQIQYDPINGKGRSSMRLAWDTSSLLGGSGKASTGEPWSLWRGQLILKQWWKRSAIVLSRTDQGAGIAKELSWIMLATAPTSHPSVTLSSAEVSFNI